MKMQMAGLRRCRDIASFTVQRMVSKLWLEGCREEALIVTGATKGMPAGCQAGPIARHLQLCGSADVSAATVV